MEWEAVRGFEATDAAGTVEVLGAGEAAGGWEGTGAAAAAAVGGEAAAAAAAAGEAAGVASTFFVLLRCGLVTVAFLVGLARLSRLSSLAFCFT